MNRRRWLLVALLLGVVITGCGPSREKGVNKDYDRPKGSGK